MEWGWEHKHHRGTWKFSVYALAHTPRSGCRLKSLAAAPLIFLKDSGKSHVLALSESVAESFGSSFGS